MRSDGGYNISSLNILVKIILILESAFSKRELG